MFKFGNNILKRMNSKHFFASKQIPNKFQSVLSKLIKNVFID